MFYNGLLETEPACTSNVRPKGFDWADRRHTAFIHVDGYECREGSSFRNPRQAHATAQLIRRLLKPGDFKARDIVVLTAYNGQRKVLDETVGRVLDKSEIKIMSVDSAQGQEYPIIILNTVRSNQQGAIGFLDSAQRLNVSLTRAKNACFIVGDLETLAYGDNVQNMWQQLFLHCTCYSDRWDWFSVLPVDEDYLFKIVEKWNWWANNGSAKNFTQEVADENAKSSNDDSLEEEARATEIWHQSFGAGLEEDGLLGEVIPQLIKTMLMWRLLTKQVLDNPCFNQILSFIQRLPKKKQASFTLFGLGKRIVLSF